MSYILIDAGNSCLKVAIVNEQDYSEIFYSILTYDNLYDELIDELFDCLPSEIIVSNVNNSLVFHIISDVSYELWRIEPYLVITQQDRFGISTRYKNPRLLGSDRWIGLIAARREFKGAFCLVDCGTAVTIDVVTEEGMHVGGLITPGLKIARESLGLKTNNLSLKKSKNETGEANHSILAITTEDAINGGTLYQLSAYIERIVSEIKLEFGDNIQCIITGGNAEQIQKLSLHNFHFSETLLLEGLRVVANDKFKKEYK